MSCLDYLLLEDVYCRHCSVDKNLYFLPAYNNRILEESFNEDFFKVKLSACYCHFRLRL